MISVCLPFIMCLLTVVPVAASVSADETEALKAEITKAVEKVQEAGKSANNSLYELKHVFEHSHILRKPHKQSANQMGSGMALYNRISDREKQQYSKIMLEIFDQSMLKYNSHCQMSELIQSEQMHQQTCKSS